MNPLFLIYAFLIAESTSNNEFLPEFLISKPIVETENISRIELGDYDTESILFFEKENRIMLIRTEDYIDIKSHAGNNEQLFNYIDKHYSCFPENVNLSSESELKKATKTFIIEPYYECYGE